MRPLIHASEPKHKVHIATDTAGVIKEIRTTTAKVHDSQMIDELTGYETKAVFADSGYMSQDRKRSLRVKMILAGIIERRVRGQSNLGTNNLVITNGSPKSEASSKCRLHLSSV
ncbi:MAG: transposase [Campylobacterales bacterium]|nr:transposase [Campylobacterales bacterium]